MWENDVATLKPDSFPGGQGHQNLMDLPPSSNFGEGRQTLGDKVELSPQGPLQGRGGWAGWGQAGGGRSRRAQEGKTVVFAQKTPGAASSTKN